jgi:hypothetical protein
MRRNQPASPKINKFLIISSSLQKGIEQAELFKYTQPETAGECTAT